MQDEGGEEGAEEGAVEGAEAGEDEGGEEGAVAREEQSSTGKLALKKLPTEIFIRTLALALAKREEQGPTGLF